MQISKLFGVLVVGGSLVSGCGEEEQPASPDAGGGIVEASTELISSGTVDIAVIEPQSGELIDCGFCPNEMCCEDDGEGNSTVKVGFECCWGTEC